MRRCIRFRYLCYWRFGCSSFFASRREKANRQDLFNQIRKEKETFTAYERFMYNDNQQTTINSAPGLGTNLAGNNFKNTYVSPDTNIYTIMMTILKV